MKTNENWIERESYTSSIAKHISNFKRNLLLLGPPKSGKTSIIKESIQKSKIPYIYLDLSRISLSPESFSIEFVGNVCYALIEQKAPYKNFLDIDFLISLKKYLKPVSYDILSLIQNETQKIKPNQKLMLDLAFKFLESHDRKIIVVLDNIEHLLDLNNFSQIKDITSLLTFKQKNTLYITASSYPTLVQKSFKDFETITIENLDITKISDLLSKKGVTNKETIQKIYKLTSGNPYLVSLLLENNDKDIEEFLLKELLNKNGKIYSHCQLLLENYLSRTSGKTLSKIILRVIANKQGLKLSQIARKIFRPAPVTKSLLERLIASDAITKKDNLYYLSNSTLAIWISSTSSNLDSLNIEDAIKEAKKIYEK
tara:strand:- start:21164 stop:22273 length:1110 start_codon:yes stop_codon:yes gene_type:complete